MPSDPGRLIAALAPDRFNQRDENAQPVLSREIGDEKKGTDLKSVPFNAFPSFRGLRGTFHE